MKRPTHLSRATFGDERTLGMSPFTNAILHGLGSSTIRPVNGDADKNFLEYYLENAAGGSVRGLYLRLYHTLAGADGEAARLFTTVQDVGAASAKGAHISLSFGSSGYITGEGIAARNTLQVPNAAMHAAGTYAASQAEIWCDGASSDPTPVTQISLFRATLGGNATGVGKTDLKAALLALEGNAIGAGKIMAEKTAAAVSHTLRIVVNGTPYYLMVSDAQ